MSTSIAFASAIATWSWIGRKDGSVERTSLPGPRRLRVAMYSPSIPPFVRRTSKDSSPRSSKIASASPGTPPFLGYRLNSLSSTLSRIASRIAGWTGSVFVFCDIHATSRRCACAKSKLSFDVMALRGSSEAVTLHIDLGCAGSREDAKEFGGGPPCPLHDARWTEDRGACGGRIRGSGVVGAVLPLDRGRRRGRPGGPREADLQLEAFLPVRGRHGRRGSESQGLRCGRHPRWRRGTGQDAAPQGDPVLHQVDGRGPQGCLGDLPCRLGAD